MATTIPIRRAPPAGMVVAVFAAWQDYADAVRAGAAVETRRAAFDQAMVLEAALWRFCGSDAARA